MITEDDTDNETDNKSMNEKILNSTPIENDPTRNNKKMPRTPKVG